MADEGDDRPVSTTFEGAAGTERFDSRFEWTPADRPAHLTAYFAAALPYAVGSVLAVGIVVPLVSNAAAIVNVDGEATVDPSALNPFDDGETGGGELGAATPTPTPQPTDTPTEPTDSPTATDMPTPPANVTTSLPVLDNATEVPELDPGSDETGTPEPTATDCDSTICI